MAIQEIKGASLKFLGPYKYSEEHMKYENGAYAYRQSMDGRITYVIYHSMARNLFFALDAQFATGIAAMNHLDEYLELDGWTFLSQDRVEKLKSLL